MPIVDSLTEREARVLGAIIQLYIETAEPAGSQAVARRSGLGMSSATVRNTMSDLEARGYLFHTHTSAGRIPTERAYRVYVDRLTSHAAPSDDERELIQSQVGSGRTAFDEILRRAAQVLGVLTQELGVAVAPALDTAILERLELVRLNSERLLVVINLKSGLMRTIFMEIPGSVAADVVEPVARILNERLAGLSLAEIRESLADRLRDAAHGPAGSELLNVFVAQGDEVFDVEPGDAGIMLGSTRALAGEPVFGS
jgi:heat-inducible transcriptional repressor